MNVSAKETASETGLPKLRRWPRAAGLALVRQKRSSRDTPKRKTSWTPLHTVSIHSAIWANWDKSAPSECKSLARDMTTPRPLHGAASQHNHTQPWTAQRTSQTTGDQQQHQGKESAKDKPQRRATNNNTKRKKVQGNDRPANTTTRWGRPERQATTTADQQHQRERKCSGKSGLPTRQ